MALGCDLFFFLGRPFRKSRSSPRKNASGNTAVSSYCSRAAQFDKICPWPSVRTSPGKRTRYAIQPRPRLVLSYFANLRLACALPSAIWRALHSRLSGSLVQPLLHPHQNALTERWNQVRPQSQSMIGFASRSRKQVRQALAIISVSDVYGCQLAESYSYKVHVAAALFSASSTDFFSPQPGATVRGFR